MAEMITNRDPRFLQQMRVIEGDPDPVDRAIAHADRVLKLHRSIPPSWKPETFDPQMNMQGLMRTARLLGYSRVVMVDVGGSFQFYGVPRSQDDGPVPAFISEGGR